MRFVLNPGQLFDAVQQNAVRAVQACHPGKAWEIKIELFKHDRSIEQNNYLNGIAYRLIGKAIGYERDDISEYLCGAHFGWKVVKLPDGREIERPVRTTTKDAYGRRSVLSKAAFAEYVDFVQRFGARHGVHIPDPEKQL